jgi:hypothetical protein
MSLVRRAVNSVLPAKYAKGMGRLLDVARADHGYHEVAHRREFMRRAFEAQRFNGISGDYAEFGCWGGVTFSLAHEESRRRGMRPTLWAFDSFQGLPAQALPEDEHPVWQAGALSTSLAEFRAICARNGIPADAYRVVPGFYEDTIGPAARFDGPLPADIAVAYVDCDMYSSTTTVLHFLAPRMKHGMIIAFDDYFCYSPTAVAGERKAMLDFLARDGRFEFLPYVQFGWHGMSFVLEDRALLAASPAREGGR